MPKTVSLTPAVFHLPEAVNRVSRTYGENPIVPRGPRQCAVVASPFPSLLSPDEWWQHYGLDRPPGSRTICAAVPPRTANATAIASNGILIDRRS